MTLADRLPAVHYARDLRFQLSLGWGRIEPAEVCAALNIRYLERDLGHSGREAGALVCSRAGRLAVVVNKNILHLPRRRFTGAHELGHICLPWHATREYWCTLSDIQNYRPDRAVEREANEFAAELLLPERVLREHLKRRPPSVALAQEIANEYGTSLTATLLSIVGLSDDDFCAVVLSGDDGVKWSFSSPPLRKCGTLPTRGQPVPADSLAATALAGWPGPNEPSPVPESTWVQGWTGGLLGHVMEHALYSPDLGTVLSFLFLPEATFVGED